MAIRRLTSDVFSMAIERLAEQYAAGHRLVVSTSTGKDSTVILELAVIAATLTDRLPVDVIMRDEEILLPGSFEYAERIYNRPEINMKWVVAGQPIINAFNRENPYWWVFDDRLDPSEWVRQPPPFAEWIPDKMITSMNNPKRFPPAEGKDLMSIIGLRVQESQGRLYGLHSSGGYMTKPQAPYGVRLCRPIYDWTDGDVWKAILENGWDYNKAYDNMAKWNIPRARMRIGPPTMSAYAAPEFRIYKSVFPEWYNKVARRLHGVEQVARYGKKALLPERRAGESWAETFQRECIDRAPKWIAARAEEARTKLLRMHSRHATTPFPDFVPCHSCMGNSGSWRKLSLLLYNGDPFSLKVTVLPYVEPEFFREGAGKWGGRPSG
jgi:predicted phosphoadenosine phosphosulfate sulfurtransferase